MSQPRRLLARKPACVQTMQRNPSSLGSKTQPVPQGIGPVPLSMGWGSRSTTVADPTPNRPSLDLESEADHLVLVPAAVGAERLAPGLLDFVGMLAGALRPYSRIRRFSRELEFAATDDTAVKLPSGAREHDHVVTAPILHALDVSAARPGKAPYPPSVPSTGLVLTCANCANTISEDYADVAGWRYWSDGSASSTCSARFARCVSSPLTRRLRPMPDASTT